LKFSSLLHSLTHHTYSLNRLIHQTSPYLLQHAHNPVDWYPWGEEALQRARAENKPILVSIGYSACHWCHVMERESFEDASTADIMNSHFINIKIDREERPDIDAIYMDAVQMITGSGGWPLNVFLTPDAKPFFGGTYFPPVRAYNRQSWKEVLHSISQVWQEKPTEIIAQAENLTEHIRNSNMFGNAPAGDPDFSDEQLQVIANNLLKAADTTWGGFGRAPKFPQTFSILFLLRHYHFTKDEAALNHALLSLDKMIEGGMYDHLGGGFARYCTDNKWQVPHFEKMLYDNALLIAVISEAYQLTQKDIYRETIEQTMHFIRSEWQTAAGGFYSAYDADSEGVEGKFYTWSRVEIEEILQENAGLFCEFYDISEEGNWEHTNIIWITERLPAFCKNRQLDEGNTAGKLQECRQKLFVEREKRIKPLLDDKILMGWNALMVTACCKAFAALQKGEYRQMAIEGVDFIEKFLKKDDGSYHHNFKKTAENPAFLDDMAMYIQALINTAEITGNNEYLNMAKYCTELVELQFNDAGTPFYFYTNKTQSDVVVRKKDWYDGATPSGNSIMAANLHYLSIIFDHAVWLKKAREMAATVAATAAKYPTSFSNWSCLIQQFVYGTNEIVVSGSFNEPVLGQVLSGYCPNKVLQSQTTPTQDFPLLYQKEVEATTLIYLCKNYQCNAPVKTVDELWGLLTV